MNFEALKASAEERLEFFPPASPEQIDQLRKHYANFDLWEYIELLENSNGVGELFCEGQHHFVHNMLFFELAEALKESEQFRSSFLAIGSPGVDGIRFGLVPTSPQIFAYQPIDQEFVPLARGLEDFIARWFTNDLHL